MFAKVSDNEIVEYPVNPVADFPHMSFPANWQGGIIGNHKFVVVERTLPPDSGVGKVITEGTPVLENGVWKQTWKVSHKQLKEHRQEIKDWLADYRYVKETSGIKINDVVFATDREAQTKYLSLAFELAQVNLETYSIKWKTKDGFVTLNGLEMFNVINTVRAHVQNCFNKEAEYIEMIDSAKSSKSLAAIDFTKGWPE